LASQLEGDAKHDMDIVRSILATFDQPHWPESLCWESQKKILLEIAHEAHE